MNEDDSKGIFGQLRGKVKEAWERLQKEDDLTSGDRTDPFLDRLINGLRDEDCTQS